MDARLKRRFTSIALVAVTIAAATLMGYKIPAMYKEWTRNHAAGDYSAHVAGLPQKITLYGTTTCPACVKARAFLHESGTPFNDQLIDQSERAKKMYARLGESAVPILVSEKKLMVGFNPEAYTRMVTSESQQ